MGTSVGGEPCGILFGEFHGKFSTAKVATHEVDKCSDEATAIELNPVCFTLRFVHIERR